MTLLFYFLGLALGVAILVKSADWFTDAAVETAHRLRIPHIIVGATLVSLATTLPEFAVSFSAAVRGEVDMSVGNAVGSTICNVGLILGICAVLAPMGVARHGFLTNSLGLIALIATFGVLGYVFPDGSRWTGIFMVAGLGIYLAHVIRVSLHHRRHGTDEYPPPEMSVAKVILLFVVGTIGIAGGSQLMLASGERLALALGVSRLVVGLTFLAIGTSTPEMVVSLTSIVKKQRSLSIGNIIGANILNLAWVIGTSSLVRPLPVRPQTQFLDLPITMLLSVLLLVFGLTGQRLSRWEGAVLFSIYVAYLLVVFVVFKGAGFPAL